MRRSDTALLAITLLVGDCTHGEESSSTGIDRGGEPVTTTARPVAVHESIDADTPYFDTVLEPDTLQWTPLPPGSASDSPSFIHAVDATTGAATRRRGAVPGIAAASARRRSDHLLIRDPGEEDFVAAIGRPHLESGLVFVVSAEQRSGQM